MGHLLVVLPIRDGHRTSPNSYHKDYTTCRWPSLWDPRAQLVELRDEPSAAVGEDPAAYRVRGEAVLRTRSPAAALGSSRGSYQLSTGVPQTKSSAGDVVLVVL
ncbi:hypothetical protein V6N12_030601 [Hibiscus sabdariffa]|uniref:Uncharacterized protein n=1 Tax=Hibiscus sabdariffa TaxID=183260 RepID=A0ABR2AIV0_9ROSI